MNDIFFNVAIMFRSRISTVHVCRYLRIIYVLLFVLKHMGFQSHGKIIYFYQDDEILLRV